MTPKEAARIILLNSINNVLDLKPVAWSSGGFRYTAEHWPAKQDWAWKVCGNSFECYKNNRDVIGQLVGADSIEVEWKVNREG